MVEYGSSCGVLVPSNGVGMVGTAEKYHGVTVQAAASVARDEHRLMPLKVYQSDSFMKLWPQQTHLT